MKKFYIGKNLNTLSIIAFRFKKVMIKISNGLIFVSCSNPLNGNNSNTAYNWVLIYIMLKLHRNRYLIGKVLLHLFALSYWWNNQPALPKSTSTHLKLICRNPFLNTSLTTQTRNHLRDLTKSLRKSCYRLHVIFCSSVHSHSDTLNDLQGPFCAHSTSLCITFVTCISLIDLPQGLQRPNSFIPLDLIPNHVSHQSGIKLWTKRGSKFCSIIIMNVIERGVSLQFP